MRFFKHPVHLMLIHFPSALLPMELVLSFLYYQTKEANFGTAAFYCLVGGVALGWLSAVTGLIDLIMARQHKNAMNTMLLHGGINLTVIMVFSIFAWKAWKLYPATAMPTLTILIIKTFVILLLFIGNYFGGRLIMKYHIAIEHERSTDQHG